jgi:transcriptional regulator with XRE-family HTH domain
MEMAKTASKTQSKARSTASKGRAAKNQTASEPFGPAIEKLMSEKGVSYRSMAEKTGLSAGYLNHLVHGNRPVPANSVMEKVAKSLGVKADRFREYRVRRISDHLAKKPELVDKLYKDLLK